MIMSFCKNTLHSFLGIPNRDSSPPTGAGLNSITGEHRKPPNIIESASVKPSTNHSGGSAGFTSGGSGCLDRLSSCTESLGFESSDQMEETIIGINTVKELAITPMKIKGKQRIRDEVKKFPPILSSLRRTTDGVGECKTSFLKPVRENGRLILTEITINRPEVFRASRQDGRLRLQFVNKAEQSEVSKKNTPVVSGGGGGEGLWRCNEQNHHHRRNRNQLQMPLWNQQCVTSQ